MYLVSGLPVRLLDSVLPQALRSLPNETISLNLKSILASFLIDPKIQLLD